MEKILITSLKQLLGVEELAVMDARLLISASSIPGMPGINKIGNLHKLMLAGSAFTEVEKFSPSKWEMVECDIIVIPRAFNRGIKLKNMEGGTLSQMLTGGFNDEKQWKVREVIKQNKKI